MARIKGENKKDRLAREVAKAVGAGVEWHLETVDFADPNRPKTCLEVDFPIIPVNRIASLEATSGAAKKPIYQMSKWWARRQSSVFRAMLIAAATKAPDDPAEAAKLVWDAYYGNHKKNEAFRNLNVADIFMGGGTTIVEGTRLGLNMYGNDLNPIAWLIVKNELTQVNLADVKALLKRVEADVKTQIMPFYACDCPRGHKGKWTHKSTGRLMEAEFDPLALSVEERGQYSYDGPEIVYTFWAKHGPCQKTTCQHRTPIMSSPIVAAKSLSVKAWIETPCVNCGVAFDVEEALVRLAPDSMYVVSGAEKQYAILLPDRTYHCPSCGHLHRGTPAGKQKNKSVEATILVHPAWVAGSPGYDSEGREYGGRVTDDDEATHLWNQARTERLSLIEVRGPLEDQFILPDSGIVVNTGTDGGTVPKDRHFTCMEATCGSTQLILAATERTGKPRPSSAYAIQVYCPTCEANGSPNRGKSFASATWLKGFTAANKEWSTRSIGDLSGYWPTDEVPYGSRTHVKDPLPKHGYTHWWRMFNPRQLLTHSILFKSIMGDRSATPEARLLVLGAFQQYLRLNNMFTIWHAANNQISAFLSNSNFNPKNNVVETSVFNPVGDGSWRSAIKSIAEALEWGCNPWELVPKASLEASSPHVAEQIGGKSAKVYPNDSLSPTAILDCKSSTDLSSLGDCSQDLVITDPPFGGLVQYSELSDFFYVWLKQALQAHLPGLPVLPTTPNTLEVVSNETRNPDEPDSFYKRLLVICWTEARRILKDQGILAFTFHHSEDDPWVDVLESLFESGFYLEATYPIRSDETKGQGEFGSKKIEYDIIHVCRKRTEEPQPISWARLRRMILQDVRQLRNLLEQHHNAGLLAADLQVIRRGKALEYYSRHFGQVYIERGREFPVKDALLAINQMLDEETDSTTDAPPAHAEAYTRQFLRLFTDRISLPRDQMSKHMRGTGVSPQEFVDRGWCEEKQKVFHALSPLDWARTWRGVARSAMSRDFDQSMFMVGACYEGSGIKLSDTLNSPTFVPHPATGDILDWFVRHGADPAMKSAAHTARQLFQTWLSKKENQEKLRQQQLQFGFDEGGE